mgnify:CR=1 FL=1
MVLTLNAKFVSPAIFRILAEEYHRIVPIVAINKLRYFCGTIDNSDLKGTTSTI